MSILLAVNELIPATAPISESDSTLAQLIASAVLLGLLMAAIGLAFYLRVFRRLSILGPARVPRGRPLWRLIVSLSAAVVIWLGAQTAYVAVRAFEHTQRQPQSLRSIPPDRISGYELERTAEPFGMADLTPADFAFLATVPGLIALIAIIIGDAIISREWFASLGWTWRHLPLGVAFGFVASLITLPIVYSFTFFLDWFYKFIEFVHPEQHELLGSLKSADNDFLRISMIAGAAIVAPLWEEVAFRGHLQTLIGAGFQKLFGPTRPAGVSVGAPTHVSTHPHPNALPKAEGIGDNIVANVPTPIIESASGTNALLPAPLPEIPMEGLDIFAQDAAPPTGPTITQRWIAIITTSCLFAGVHEMWTWPAIFVLSVCLGYAYERTGNLWVPIAIHLAFNSVSTALFLLQVV